MKYRVVKNDGEDPEPTIIEVDSDTSPENEDKMHRFDIQDYAENAILCEEGSYIEIGVRFKSG